MPGKRGPELSSEVVKCGEQKEGTMEKAYSRSHKVGTTSQRSLTKRPSLGTSSKRLFNSVTTSMRTLNAPQGNS